ncbi:MAG: hypothetical protein WBQ44_15520 [Rhodococcus sp. (in: high G+C Gram-positive bacteria)]
MSITDSRAFGRLVAASSNSSLGRRFGGRAPSRTQVADAAIMIGALSIVSFWALGLGVVLGIFAVAAALWADRGPSIPGDRPSRDDVMIAVGSGIVGAVVGIGFLLMVFPV